MRYLPQGYIFTQTIINPLNETLNSQLASNKRIQFPRISKLPTRSRPLESQTRERGGKTERTGVPTTRNFANGEKKGKALRRRGGAAAQIKRSISRAGDQHSEKSRLAPNSLSRARRLVTPSLPLTSADDAAFLNADVWALTARAAGKKAVGSVSRLSFLRARSIDDTRRLMMSPGTLGSGIGGRCRLWGGRGGKIEVQEQIRLNLG